MGWAALILSLTDCQCSWLWGYSLRYTIAFNRRTKGLTPWRAGFWQECEIGELCRVGKKHLNSRDMLTCGHKALWCSVSLLIKAVTVSSPSWSFVSSKMKYLWGRDGLMNYKLVIIIGMYYLWRLLWYHFLGPHLGPEYHTGELFQSLPSVNNASFNKYNPNCPLFVSHYKQRSHFTSLH